MWGRGQIKESFPEEVSFTPGLETAIVLFARSAVGQPGSSTGPTRGPSAFTGSWPLMVQRPQMASLTPLAGGTEC